MVTGKLVVMPRTKSFDVDEVLERAVDLFWVNGYAATSMEDLVQHLGINRGSLYATFGSKEELYERALNRYVDDSISWFTDNMADTARPLRARLADVLTSSVNNPDYRGCMLVNSAAERNAVHDPTRTTTSAALSRIRDTFVDAFTASADPDQPGDALADDITPTAAADLLMVTMQGLKVMSTMNGDRDGLDEVIELTLDRIFIGG